MKSISDESSKNESINNELTKNAHNVIISKNKDMFEVVQYVNKDFPLKVELHFLSMFVFNSFECHWHNEIEILTVVKGRMKCFVDDNEILLEEGKGIVISSNRLHYARAVNDEDCEYIAILIEPEFLAEKDGLIYRKYVEPVVYNPKVPFTVFSKEKEPLVYEETQKLLNVMNTKEKGYELDAVVSMLKLWREIVRIVPCEAEEVSGSIGYVKRMLAYIHSNFTDDISVNDLAEAVNLSYGEACRIFKKSINQTIVNYIQTYRIKKSIPLLKAGEMNISEVAVSVGFNGASYYSEVFRKVTGKSPNEYKNE